MLRNKLTTSILIIFLALCSTSGINSYVSTTQTNFVETVKTVTVTVKEKKNLPVPKLEANDFQVFQDGKPVPVIFAMPSNEMPLNLAIVIQEGLPQVNLEVDSVRQFITSLPSNSKVMLVYTKNSFVSVAQDFTSNLAKVANKVRVIDSFSSTYVSPYLDLRTVLPYFNGLEVGRNEILFISDGYDPFNGTFSSPMSNLYLGQVMREAQKNNITIFSLYTPSPRVKNFFARNSGIDSLSYLSEQTGGECFYMTSGFVTFDAPLQNFAQLLDQQYLISYLSNGIDKKYHQIKVTTDFSNIKVLVAKEFRF